MRSIFPIILILIALGFFFFFVNPLYHDVSTLRTDVASYNQALSHSTDLQKTRDTLLATYNGITTNDKARLEKFLPNTVNNIELILELEKIASAHNMALKNIRFETPDDSSDTSKSSNQVVSSTSGSLPYGVFQLEFNTEADYSVFTAFLKDVEHNLRLIDVKSLSFDASSKDTDNNDNTKTVGLSQSTYKYSVKVNTYWLKH